MVVLKHALMGLQMVRTCCVVYLACESSICIACRSHEHQANCLQTGVSVTAQLNVTLITEHICSHCCVVLLACGSSVCIACRSHAHQVDCAQIGLNEAALLNVTLTPGLIHSSNLLLRVLS